MNMNKKLKMKLLKRLYTIERLKKILISKSITIRILKKSLRSQTLRNGQWTQIILRIMYLRKIEDLHLDQMPAKKTKLFILVESLKGREYLLRKTKE